MQEHDALTEDAAGKIWDAIIIGTGIGGGTLGRRLAERGFSVLFVEKGHLNPPFVAAEQFGLESPEARLSRGLWPTSIMATINGQQSSFFGPVGAGVGGSSVFYAATLERPERHNIDETEHFPHPTGGWPVSFDAFLDYFAAAEQMYLVRGDADPLSAEAHAELLPPVPFDPVDESMVKGFRRRGLNPYHSHIGIRDLSGCDFCFGIRCHRACKMDARTAGIEPALVTGKAAMLDGCKVVALNAQADQVTEVRAEHNGRAISLRARTYILAAGAFSSPRILLASKSKDWPQGLANGNGLVGRNLMFHLTEMIAIWPEGEKSVGGPTRAISLRDFYANPPYRYGTFQAMGVNVTYGEIVHYLNGVFERSFLRRLRPLRHLLRIPAYVATKVFGQAKVFAGILEDLPYAENRVLLDPDDPERIIFRYRVSDELMERRSRYKAMIKARFKGLRSVFLNIQPELNFAHVCGTLRFGNDPKSSVLNSDCRAHGVQNLYVVDASFMPTSAGVNPSLTIAANALRVAEKIATHLQETAVVADIVALDANV